MWISITGSTAKNLTNTSRDMPAPSKHKTVQARILAYAEAIGWTFVSREEAELRRGSDSAVPPAERARSRSLFFDDPLNTTVREFNPRYAEAEGALLGRFLHLHTDIYANREKFFDHEEKRERDLTLIHSKKKKKALHA
jgi:type I restriction enzyme R subunit